MGDMISRKAAIEALQNHYEVRNPKQNAIMDECVMLISNVPSVQPQRWIPVTEALPEKKTEVIYSLENHFVSTGYMTDRDYKGDEIELHWEDMESGVLIYPEAWMPLPKPYAERKEDASSR